MTAPCPHCAEPAGGRCLAKPWCPMAGATAPEPYDVEVLIAQRDAANARAAAAEAVASKLAEDARLLLQPLVALPPGIFHRRPHLFRIVFAALVAVMRERRPA